MNRPWIIAEPYGGPILLREANLTEESVRTHTLFVNESPVEGLMRTWQALRLENVPLDHWLVGAKMIMALPHIPDMTRYSQFSTSGKRTIDGHPLYNSGVWDYAIRAVPPANYCMREIPGTTWAPDSETRAALDGRCHECNAPLSQELRALLVERDALLSAQTK